MLRTLGSRSTNGRANAIVEMNTTPLIDVLLVLLVMLILTIPMQTHAVKLDMPIHVPPASPPPPAVELGVDFDGTITWNGVVVPDLTALDNHLAAEGRKPASDQAEIRVRANRLAKYGAVARVMADAQRLGVRKIGVAGGEQYMD